MHAQYTTTEWLATLVADKLRLRIFYLLFA